MIDNNVVTKKRNVAFTEAVAPRPKTQMELDRRLRSLSFADAFMVVEWLNATRGSAAHQRVLAVRKELKELGETLTSLRQRRSEARAGRRGRKAAMSQEDVYGSVDRAKDYEGFRQRHNALNLTLARYVFVPVMAYDLDAGIWQFSSVPKATRGRTIEASDGALKVQIDEASVVAALARLAANRELHKARLCDQCQVRWRISERTIDRFCSTECRQAWHMKSPEYGKRRREIQKLYRDNLKRKMANEDAALKGKG